MISWAYLAGFLDGDGWITGSQNKNCRTRSCVVGWLQSATEKEAMRRVFQFLKRNGIRAVWRNRLTKTPSSPKPYPMVHIYVKQQESIVLLLKHLTPHLLIKRNLAKVALAYTQDRLEKRGHNVVVIRRMRKRRPWTKLEEVQLKNLRTSGYGYKAIAVKLNRSIHSLYQKAAA